MPLFQTSGRSHSRSLSTSRSNANLTASTAAHSAATQAFLASRQSAPNLSASAAAAALRSMSPTPTNVAQVQTRRTMQRQASNSSTGSAMRGRGPPGSTLQRQSSSGSMTERTFRTPSPHGPGLRGGRAPPVPRLPDDYADVSPLPVKKHRRAASLEPPPPRVQSPPLTRPAGRGQSLDRSGPNVQPKRPTGPRTSGLQKINELERTDSNNSINFSYPRNARPNSPPPRSPVLNQDSPVPNPMRNGISPAAAEVIQHDLNQTAEQPVKKKKKKVVAGSAEGTHFQSASMQPMTTPGGSGPERTAVSEATPAEPIKKKKKKVAVTGQSSHFHPEETSSRDDSESDSTPEKVMDRRAQRASGNLNKQPSVVREDWEGEQVGEPTIAADEEDRFGQGARSVSTSSTAIPSKKPSTAANVSKKIDEASAPQRVTPHPIYDSVTLPQTSGPASAPAASTEPTQPVKHTNVLSAQSQGSRTASLSPSRSTRFSDRLSSDLASGRKHEPLPRSVSPAKSALKHHSPSPQAASPVDGQFPPRRRTSSQTPSDASDNNSSVSADGYAPAARQKKSARVSFQQEPEVVGVAAQSEQNDSSQNKDPGRKSWFGFGRTKSSALGTIPAEDDMEEVMAPRPALPMFGSVRGKNRAGEAVDPASSRQSRTAPTPGTAMSAFTAATMSSASSSSSSGPPTMDTSVSSDHAIGALLAQDALSAKSRSSNQPVSPEVTSVEGTGYAPNTTREMTDSAQAPTDPPQRGSHVDHSTMQPLSGKTTSVNNQNAEEIPSISVQPATPGLEQGQSQDQWLVEVPGGFPSVDPVEPSITNVEATSPAGLGISEPAPPETVSTAGPTESPLTALSLSLHNQSHGDADDRSSDADSIYSDAAESQADLEGDGFGSINAIMESPMVPVSSNRSGGVPDSPLARGQDRPDVPGRTTSWDTTQAHWSGLASQYRQGLYQQTPPDSPGGAVAEEPTAKMVKQQRKPPQYRDGLYQTQESQTGAQAPKQRDEPPRQMRQSTPKQRDGPPRQVRQGTPVQAPSEAAPAPKPRMKKKTGTSGALAAATAAVPAAQRISSQQATLPPPISKKQTPATHEPSNTKTGLDPAQNLRTQQPNAAPPPKIRGTLQKRQIPPAVPSTRPASSGGATAAAPTSRGKPVQRTFSNDSDSESSFRKQRRRANSGSDGKYTMKRSMRATADAEPTAPTGRKAIRSLSPVARRPFSPVGGQKPMRSSMRASMDSTGPTLRGQPEQQQQRSSSLFGRKSQALSPVRSAQSKPTASKHKSRFAADSDDEDGPLPKSYRSRFEDSSDEEPEPTKYTPVRGIPRKIDEGDSTDLADSSDEGTRARKARTPPKIITQQLPEPATGGSDVPQSPLSPTSEKKRGLFSRFRSKKTKEVPPKSKLGETIAERNAAGQRQQQFDAEAAHDPESLSQPNKKVKEEKTRPSNLGFGSVAERDAMIERTRAQLQDAKDQQRPSSPSVGKAQRRETPQRMMSDSWPLPPKNDAGEDAARPTTSDGVAILGVNGTNGRPGLKSRDNTSTSIGGTPVYGKSGKKKRFPKLRKAFGLND